MSEQNRVPTLAVKRLPPAAGTRPDVAALGLTSNVVKIVSSPADVRNILLSPRSAAKLVSPADQEQVSSETLLAMLTAGTPARASSYKAMRAVCTPLAPLEETMLKLAGQVVVDPENGGGGAHGATQPPSSGSATSPSHSSAGSIGASGRHHRRRRSSFATEDNPMLPPLQASSATGGGGGRRRTFSTPPPLTHSLSDPQSSTTTENQPSDALTMMSVTGQRATSGSGIVFGASNRSRDGSGRSLHQAALISPRFKSPSGPASSAANESNGARRTSGAGSSTSHSSMRSPRADRGERRSLRSPRQNRPTSSSHATATTGDDSNDTEDENSKDGTTASGRGAKAGGSVVTAGNSPPPLFPSSPSLAAITTSGRRRSRSVGDSASATASRASLFRAEQEKMRGAANALAIQEEQVDDPAGSLMSPRSSNRRRKASQPNSARGAPSDQQKVPPVRLMSPRHQSSTRSPRHAKSPRKLRRSHKSVK